MYSTLSPGASVAVQVFQWVLFSGQCDQMKVTEVRDHLLPIFGEKVLEEAQIGDLLHLREWDPMSELYTDREIMACIGYVHRGWGLLPGFCILGFE